MLTKAALYLYIAALVMYTHKNKNSYYYQVAKQIST